MGRNEDKTCRELIEPELQRAGWSWDRHLQLGPGRVNISGRSMYDSAQLLVVDYVLRVSRLPLAILEAKAEHEEAANGIQQGQRYADRLGLRFAIASNGHEYLLIDRNNGKREAFQKPPTPGDILHRLGDATHKRNGGNGRRLSFPPQIHPARSVCGEHIDA